MADYKRNVKEAHQEEQKRLPEQAKKAALASEPAPEQVAGAQASREYTVKSQPTLKDAAQFNTAVDRNVDIATTDPKDNPNAKPAPGLQSTPQPTNTPKPRPAGS